MSSVQKIGSVLDRHPIGLGPQELPRYAFGEFFRRVAEYKRRVAEYRKLQLALVDLRNSCSHATSLDEVVGAACSNSIFPSIQKQAEIVSLLRILQKPPPHYVCEIGSAAGGTLFLFAKVCCPDALIVSIDLGLTFERSVVHSHMGNRQQRLVSIRADSRAPGTVRRVRSLLRGHKLDVLFIDGDHSYEGVKADFNNYSPLVREGGFTVFHDIVPDFRTRFGTPTDSDTGEVPRFWREIKQHQKTTEIIEDVQQDGFGIGVVHM
jgi:cephalosporin hydroxylase